MSGLSDNEPPSTDRAFQSACNLFFSSNRGGQSKIMTYLEETILHNREAKIKQKEEAGRKEIQRPEET